MILRTFQSAMPKSIRGTRRECRHPKEKRMSDPWAYFTNAGATPPSALPPPPPVPPAPPPPAPSPPAPAKSTKKRDAEQVGVERFFAPVKKTPPTLTPKPAVSLRGRRSAWALVEGRTGRPRCQPLADEGGIEASRPPKDHGTPPAAVL